MKKVTVNEWVDALVSGDYVQGKNYLRTEDGKNCCLGVLCEVAGLIFEEQVEIDGDVIIDVYRTSEDDELDYFFINEQVDGIIDTLIADPENLPKGHFWKEVDNSDFSEVNDYGGSFEDIAKILRGEMSFDEWHETDSA